MRGTVCLYLYRCNDEYACYCSSTGIAHGSTPHVPDTRQGQQGPVLGITWHNPVPSCTQSSVHLLVRNWSVQNRLPVRSVRTCCSILHGMKGNFKAAVPYANAAATRKRKPCLFHCYPPPYSPSASWAPNGHRTCGSSKGDSICPRATGTSLCSSFPATALHSAPRARLHTGICTYRNWCHAGFACTPTTADAHTQAADH